MTDMFVLRKEVISATLVDQEDDDIIEQNHENFCKVNAQTKQTRKLALTFGFLDGVLPQHCPYAQHFPVVVKRHQIVILKNNASAVLSNTGCT